MDSGSMIVAGVSALVGTGGGATVAWAVVKAAMEAYVAEHRQLKEEVKTLRDEKLGGLERRMSRVEDGCKHHQDQTDIIELRTVQESMQTTLARIDQRVGETRDTVTSTAADVRNMTGFITDVRKELRDHRANAGAHGGHQT